MNINKNIILFSPRLDIPFKNFGGGIPSKVGPPNHPLRKYWENFRQLILHRGIIDGRAVIDIRIPLWQITPELVIQYQKEYDIVLVPHKNHINFHGKNILYYMQSSIPWYFSIDHKGWGASASTWPIQPKLHIEDGHNIIQSFEDFRLPLINDNISKFAQPKVKVKLPKKFIFFPCQLPHDETIQFHSKVEVVDALKRTLECGKILNIPVLVKGHPVNSGAMSPLKDAFNQHSRSVDAWIDNVSIHQALAECEAVFTVNSGVGFEGILHKKPVFLYGHADYSAVSIIIGNENIEELWPKRGRYINQYPYFIKTWREAHINVQTLNEGTELLNDCINRIC